MTHEFGVEFEMISKRLIVCLPRTDIALHTFVISHVQEYEKNYWLVGTTSESFSLNTSLLAIIRYKCPPPCCFKLTERTVHCCNALCLKTSKGFYMRDFTVLYACFTFSVYKSKII